MIRYAVLGLLCERPDYGYRLKRRFDDRVGSLWQLNVGQVYQTLQALERTGLVREVGREHELGSPERRLFEITPKGKRLVERWLERPPTRPRPIRDETLIRLLLFEPGASTERLRHVASQERLYLKHLARLTAQKSRASTDAGDDESPPINSLALDNAILHTEAHIKWLQRCREFLEAQPAVTSKKAPHCRDGRGSASMD